MKYYNYIILHAIGKTYSSIVRHVLYYRNNVKKVGSLGNPLSLNRHSKPL